GPFLPIEQAALSHVVTDRTRTDVFAWYTLTGAMATALGALAAGTLTRRLQSAGWDAVAAYRAVVVVYAGFGGVLWLAFSRLSHAAEAETLGEQRALGAPFAALSGIDRSRGVVLKLSSLFALDAFGGGFVVQSLAAYWFHLRFGVDAGTLGGIFFSAN